jgi:acyl-coenzyme A thioesterase PaaI-like protein
VPLHHHDLCFGCGRVNLFGLLLEVERTGPDSVAGRCFFKQDHQGPDRGRVHDGVLTAALAEAMALACGEDARATSLQVELTAPVPVGTFVELQANVEHRGDAVLNASATATADQRIMAHARGRFLS